MRKTHVYKIIFLIVFWIFAGIFYEIFQGTIVGFDSLTHLPDGRPYIFEKSLITSIIVVFVSACLVAPFDVLYLSQRIQRKSLGTILLVKTVFYLTIIFIVSSLGVFLNLVYTIDNLTFNSEIITLFLNYLASPSVLLIMFYWGFAVMTGLSILHISDKFGEGVLINFVLGKYHQPKEAVRIFMFLDLSSSSKIAEVLGAFKYSSFLKDFFYDIDEVVLETKGAVYQYIGDEVVIIWDIKKGVENNNCIRCFFMLEKKISRLKEYYLEHYGNFPEFKAGVHYGKVIITEVGGSKQDIAYHGDTVNTSARIHSLCRQVGEKLLISAEILGILTQIDEGYTVAAKGIFNLKGKKNVIGLFGVSEKNKSSD